MGEIIDSLGRTDSFLSMTASIQHVQSAELPPMKANKCKWCPMYHKMYRAYGRLSVWCISGCECVKVQVMLAGFPLLFPMASILTCVCAFLLMCHTNEPFAPTSKSCQNGMVSVTKRPLVMQFISGRYESEAERLPAAFEKCS